MNSVLEIHILQNFAPSNLNRDDTGSPKDAIFGGVRRARISSQSLKRAMREYFRAKQLLGPEELAVRTKRLTQELIDRLVISGRSAEEAGPKVIAALGGMGLKVDEGKTQYLLFLGEREIGKMADLIHTRWDDLKVDTGETKKSKDAKKDAKNAVSADLGKQLRDTLDGGRAVDVALFGRMLADLPERNADAAAQVAHALGTGRAEREFDFYTAVDDLKPDDNAGADMLGTVEFVSATYYRYINLDLEQLRRNLQDDTGLLLRGVEAFLRAAVFAAPSGKQNTFAAHNLPSFVGFTVRQDASPRNLANAFEVPILSGSGQGKGLVDQSMKALGREWEKQERVYAQSGKTYYLNLHNEKDVTWKDKDTQVTESRLPGERVSNLDALVTATLDEVRTALKLQGAAD